MKTLIDKKKFGPWAVITGASSGIGKEFARQLAASGLNVILVARRLSLLEEIGHKLEEEFGIQYRVIEADLASEDFLGKIEKITSDLDVGLVICNAGAGSTGKFLESEQSYQMSVIRLNVMTNFILIHHFGQKLAKRGRGGVVLVAAMWASSGVPYLSNTAATKAYLISLGQALNTEFKKLGVNVTVLLPGPTDTPAVARLGINPKDTPMKLMSVEQCVSEGLKALNANRSIQIPGRMNRFMTAIIPGTVSRNMAAKMMENSLSGK